MLTSEEMLEFNSSTPANKQTREIFYYRKCDIGARFGCGMSIQTAAIIFTFSIVKDFSGCLSVLIELNC